MSESMILYKDEFQFYANMSLTFWKNNEPVHSYPADTLFITRYIAGAKYLFPYEAKEDKDVGFLLKEYSGIFYEVTDLTNEPVDSAFKQTLILWQDPILSISTPDGESYEVDFTKQTVLSKIWSPEDCYAPAHAEYTHSFSPVLPHSQNASIWYSNNKFQFWVNTTLECYTKFDLDDSAAALLRQLGFGEGNMIAVGENLILIRLTLDDDLTPKFDVLTKPILNKAAWGYDLKEHCFVARKSLGEIQMQDIINPSQMRVSVWIEGDADPEVWKDKLRLAVVAELTNLIKKAADITQAVARGIEI